MTFSSSAETCCLESGSAMNELMSLKFFRRVVLRVSPEHDGRDSASKVTYGMLWSTVARVQSVLLTFRPAFRRPSKACGEVTSCTRCRSM